MTALEALADSIMRFEGWVHGSRSWRNRNPGNLRNAQEQSGLDNQGYATFDSLGDGFMALRNDLIAKCNGTNRHGLGPISSLADLFAVYAPQRDRNDPAGYTRQVAEMMTQATGREFTPETKLGEIWP